MLELAAGPGLMLAVLIALAAHVIINDQAEESALYVADHHADTR